MYSTIIPKKKQLACGCFNYPFSKNRCKYHATIEDTNKRIAAAKQSEKQKPTSNQDTNNELNKWFKDIEEKYFPCYCWECGTYISKKYARSATAHILPKSIFISVSTNPNNFLILGAWCGCHHKFDNGKRTEMKIFTKAVELFSTFQHLIKEKHKLLNVFEIEIENKILSEIL